MKDCGKEDFNRMMQSLGGIRKLKQDRADLSSQKARPRPPQPRRMSDRLSPHHHNHARHIPQTTAESWFHHGLQKKLQRNIRLGKLAIDSILDLHGCRQHEAIAQLEHFLHDAVDAQARLLLIIHGKGYRSQSESVLRPLVQQWLSEQSMVMAWCPAQVADGGHGASYVYLRRTQEGAD